MGADHAIVVAVQVDLAIPSLGHRKGLMRAIHDLRQHTAAHAADHVPKEPIAESKPGSPAGVPAHHVQVSTCMLRSITHCGPVLLPGAHVMSWLHPGSHGVPTRQAEAPTLNSSGSWPSIGH